MIASHQAPPAFAAKLRNIDGGDCIHVWLNGCIIESEVNEEDVTIRADLMKELRYARPPRSLRTRWCLSKCLILWRNRRL